MFRRASYGRHWSTADDIRLRQLASEGASEQDMALALGRSRASIAERREYLRLSGGI